MQLFKKRKIPGWTALSMSSEGLGIAHVTRTGASKPGVSVSALRNTPADAAGWKSLCQEFSLDRRDCILLLSPAEYRLLQVEAPAVPADELKQAVRWRIKDMLDYPAEAATLDMVEVPADPANSGRQRMLYTVVARNEVISRHINQLIIEAGIGLSVIDIPELSQRNLAALLEDEGRALAMLSFNHQGGLLTFTAGGELYQARQIEVTLTQLEVEDEERQSHIFDRIALELQRSLDNFERQFPYLAVSRLVLAPFPAREAFREFITAYLGLRVESFALDDLLEIDSAGPVMQSLTQQAQLLGVLGAALREGEGA